MNQLAIVKKRILENTFVDTVRAELQFDQVAYDELCTLLRELARLLANETLIDKDLALVLNEIPKMIFGSYLSFRDSPKPWPEIAERLEDAATDLDDLVTECLRDNTSL